VRELDSYQDAYQRLPFEDQMVLYRRRKILEQLGIHRPRRILEVGCGLAPLFTVFNDYEVMSVVEPGEYFYRNAAKHAAGRSNVLLYEGTLEERATELARHDFDFIVLSSLLHEVEDPLSLLRVVGRLCRPKTIVHINVPNAYSVHRLLALSMGLIGSVYTLSDTQLKMQQARTFDVQSLTALVVAAGLRPIEAGTLFIKPFTHQQMANLIDANFLTPEMLEGFYKLAEYLPNYGAEIFMNVGPAAS
jgi:SAM-dependent methyltransferase